VHDLATHDLDLTTWISGQHYSTISAHTAHRSGRPHEDLLAALAHLTDGTIVHHRVNWLSPMKERTTTITGERGCLIANTLTADLTYYANGAYPSHWDALTTFRGVTEGDITRYAIPKKESLLAQHEHFRDTVLGHHPPTSPLHQGLHPIHVAHTALQAAHTKTTLPIPPPRSDDLTREHQNKPAGQEPKSLVTARAGRLPVLVRHPGEDQVTPLNEVGAMLDEAGVEVRDAEPGEQLQQRSSVSDSGRPYPVR